MRALAKWTLLLRLGEPAGASPGLELAGYFALYEALGSTRT